LRAENGNQFLTRDSVRLVHVCHMRQNPKKRIQTAGPTSPLAKLGDALPEMELPKESNQSPPTEKTATPLWKLGRVVLRRETAHRGGKTVIVVDQFATHLPLSLIETIARRIRVSCGCGGSIKGRTIELQGDQPARVRISGRSRRSKSSTPHSTLFSEIKLLACEPTGFFV
jgi:translation initiation factor 1